MSGRAEGGAVWVTRPQPDADRFAQELGAAGIGNTLIAPLIEIVFEAADVLPQTVGGWAFTSANGVRALANLTVDRSRPAYCVGPATAEAATAAGFGVAAIADSSVDSLAQVIALAAAGAAGEICHVTGSHRAGDLVAALGAAGIAARTLQLYRAAAVTELPPPAARALRQGLVSDVVLFSPRTAAILWRLVEAAGLADRLAVTRLICLSPAVAERLEGMQAADILVAASPQAGALIDIVADGRT